MGGLSIVVRSAICATTALVHERWDSERVLRALRDEGVTIVSLVPTTLGRLLDAGLREPPALRTVLLGGAPIPAALAERARAAGVPVTETYGLTEACSQVTAEEPGEASGREKRWSKTVHGPAPSDLADACLSRSTKPLNSGSSRNRRETSRSTSTNAGRP